MREARILGIKKHLKYFAETVINKDSGFPERKRQRSTMLKVIYFFCFLLSITKVTVEQLIHNSTLTTCNSFLVTFAINLFSSDLSPDKWFRLPFRYTLRLKNMKN